MKAPLRLTLALLIGVGTARPVAAQWEAGREVLRRADLHALQVHRFSDLVEWIGLGGVSLDGITWATSLEGVRTPAGDGIAWIVDGVPTDIGAFGSSFPELLPAIVQQIDSVVVTRSPTVAQGRLYPRGSVDVFTADFDPGVEARAWARHGAETGDPGPFVYTPYETRGVDQTGPDGSITASASTSTFGISAGTRYLRTDVSDPNLRSAFGSDYLAFTQVRGGQGAAWLRAGGGEHRLSVARYNQIGHSAVFGQGQFTRLDLTRSQVAIAGSLGSVDRRAGYVLSGRSFEGEGPGLWTAVSMEEVDGAAWLDLPLRAGTAGFSAAVRSGELAEALGEDRTALHGHLTGQRVGGWTASAQAGVVRVRGEWGGEGMLTLSRTVATDLGIELFAARGIEYSASGSTEPLPTSAPRVRISTVRGGIGANWQTRSDLRTTARLSAARDRYTPIQPYYAYPSQQFAVGVDAGADYRPSARWQTAVHYSGLLLDLDATAPIPRILEPPTHQLRAWAAFSVAPTFRLSAATRLESGRRYPQPRLSPPGNYYLDPLVRIDLGIDKSFWEERFRTTLSLRNLLNRTEQDHPHGADFAFRYFITGTLQLP